MTGTFRIKALIGPETGKRDLTRLIGSPDEPMRNASEAVSSFAHASGLDDSCLGFTLMQGEKVKVLNITMVHGALCS